MVLFKKLKLTSIYPIKEAILKIWTSPQSFFIKFTRRFLTRTFFRNFNSFHDVIQTFWFIWDSLHLHWYFRTNIETVQILRYYRFPALVSLRKLNSEFYFTLHAVKLLFFSLSQVFNLDSVQLICVHWTHIGKCED